MPSAWWTRWLRKDSSETANAEDADLVILNTCHIREKASEKVYSELGRLRVAKDEAAREGRDHADRGRGLRGAGRGRGDHRAARPWSTSWSARRAIIIFRSC